MAETSEVVNTELQSVDEKDSKQQAEEKTLKSSAENEETNDEDYGSDDGDEEDEDESEDDILSSSDDETSDNSNTLRERICSSTPLTVEEAIEYGNSGSTTLMCAFCKRFPKSYLVFEKNPVLFDTLAAMIKKCIPTPSSVDNEDDSLRILNGVVLPDLLSRALNISAQGTCKARMYESGIVKILLQLAQHHDRSYYGHLCTMILQNLSEHVFVDGSINPHQLELYQDGVFDFFYTMSNVSLMKCLAMANLSINAAVRARIEEEGKTDFLNAFVLCQLNELRNVNWITCQPMIGLLKSKDEAVVRMALSLLQTQAYSRLYKELTVSGLADLQFWAFSSKTDIRVAASSLLKHIVLPAVIPDLGCIDKATQSFQFCKWPIPEAFTDVAISVRSDSFKAHRVVLAENPVLLELMTAATNNSCGLLEVTIPNTSAISVAGFNCYLEFLYTGSVKASPIGVEALASAFGLRDVRFTKLVTWFLLKTVADMSLEEQLQIASLAQEHNCETFKQVLPLGLLQKLTENEPESEFHKVDRTVDAVTTPTAPVSTPVDGADTPVTGTSAAASSSCVVM